MARFAFANVTILDCKFIRSAYINGEIFEINSDTEFVILFLARIDSVENAH